MGHHRRLRPSDSVKTGSLHTIQLRRPIFRTLRALQSPLGLRYFFGAWAFGSGALDVTDNITFR